MFDASIRIQPGDGKLTKFWTDRWLNDRSIEEIAPDLHAAVPQRIRATRTLHQALQGRQWIRDIVVPISVLVLIQYLRVWEIIQEIQIAEDQADKICWRWTPSLQYSAKSAYQMFFQGSTQLDGASLVWQTWAPQRAKLFMYFALNRRTWTSERRHRHNLQDSADSALCSQAPETIEHLLLHCPIAKDVWWQALSHMQMQSRFFNNETSIADAWRRLRVQVSGSTSRRA